MKPQIDQMQWDTLRRSEGENLIVDFDATPKHLAVIPFEVLEDGLETRDEEPLASANMNRKPIENAIARALDEGDWRELVRIDTGQVLFQLWITRSHFVK